MKITDLANSILKLLETQVSHCSLSSLVNILEFQKLSLIHNKSLTLEILKRLMKSIFKIIYSK
jgi:hypothetical protein